MTEEYLSIWDTCYMQAAWQQVILAQNFPSVEERQVLIQGMSATVAEATAMAHTRSPAGSVTSAMLMMLACCSSGPATALRNLIYNREDEAGERLVDIQRFSAGSYTGMLAWHCTHIHGRTRGLRTQALRRLHSPCVSSHYQDMTRQSCLCSAMVTRYAPEAKAWESLQPCARVDKSTCLESRQ